MYTQAFILLSLVLVVFCQQQQQNASCWIPRIGSRTEYAQLTATCPDGSNVRFCGCNVVNSTYSHGLCGGQAVVGISGTDCGVFRCPDNQRLHAVTPANPSAGICCPQLECVNNSNRTRQIFAPTIDVCYVPRNNRTEFPVYSVTCPDGTTQKVCGCNVKNHSFPPGVCNNQRPASLRAVPCPLLGCRFGVEVVTPADPLTGSCCPVLKCKAPVNSTRDIPARGNPSRGNPVRGNPVRGNPVRGNPVRGNPVHGDPVRGNPVRGDPVRGDPVRGNPVRGNPARGNFTHGNSTHGNSTHGNSTRGDSNRGNSNRGNPNRGNPNRGTPTRGNPGRGKLGQNEPSHNKPMPPRTKPNSPIIGRGPRIPPIPKGPRSTCWTPRGRSTDYGFGTVNCGDGTTHDFCACNSRNASIPTGLCPNDQFTSYSAKSCPPMLCPGVTKLVAPANPQTGKCCTEYQCIPSVVPVAPVPLPVIVPESVPSVVPVDTAPISVPSDVAPDADSCWVSDSPTAAFLRTSDSCSDGVTREYCACNGGNYVYPPGYECPKNGNSASSQVTCDQPACDGQLIVNTPADPAAGQCCPVFECLSINSAVGDPVTSLDGSGTSASDIPAYGIALLVIGSVLVVVLVVALAALFVFLGRK